MLRCSRRCLISLACWCVPLTATAAQSLPDSSRITLSPTAGYLAYGTYFTAPGGVSFSNHDGFGIGAELDFRAWRSLSVIASVLHGSSDWSFESVPLVGDFAGWCEPLVCRYRAPSRVPSGNRRCRFRAGNSRTGALWHRERPHLGQCYELRVLGGPRCASELEIGSRSGGLKHPVHDPVLRSRHDQRAQRV
jgi:hypothetical protein